MEHTLRRDFIKYVSLNMLGMLGLSCYILADTFFVANRLGSDGLAALNLAICIFGLMNGLGLMLGTGGGIRYIFFQAQNRPLQARQVFSSALFWGLCLGLLFWMIGAFGASPLAYLLGARGDILTLCTTYLRTVLSFAPFFILNQILLVFVRNDGAPRLAMCAMLTGSLLNIVLDYVFLYPLNMGMFGAALATGLAPIVGISISCVHLLCPNSQLRPGPLRSNISALFQLCSLGFSALLNEISGSIILITFNSLMLSIAGTTGVAAYGIVANLALVTTALFTGLSQGVQPLLSRAYGQNRPQEVAQLRRIALRTAVGLGIGLYLLVALSSSPLTALFNKEQDPALQAMAVSGLRIYFLCYLFAGVNIIFTTFFSATQQPNPAFWMSLFRGCLGILLLVFPLSYLLGLPGIWITVPVVELVTLGGCGRYLLRSAPIFSLSSTG